MSGASEHERSGAGPRGTAATRPWRWAIAIIAGLSIVGAIASELLLVLRLDEAFLAVAEPFFWPSPHPAHPLAEDTRLGQAIGFGFWAGVSVVQLWLAWRLRDAALHAVAPALLAGHVLWYVLDSAGSAAAGAWLNVITNTAYLVALGIPLLRLSMQPEAR